MMPAPWQYPGRIDIQLADRRKSPEAKVVVKDRVAGFILNGAEVHNLGLSWFITTYLTQGRFRGRFLVLDDPEQSMDQTTFRDFCRLLETLLRLHKRARIPLTLVLLLHQDNRAVDAARATNAVLQTLGWNRNALTVREKTLVFGQSMLPPKPRIALVKQPPQAHQ
jgi:hypothetical protein